MIIITMVIDDDDNYDECDDENYDENYDEDDDEICALIWEGRNSIEDFFESKDLDGKWVEEFLSMIFWLID